MGGTAHIDFLCEMDDDENKGTYNFEKPTTMSTEKGTAISTEGEYEMDAKGVINPTKPSEKPLSEVEKAQASVKEWRAKVETYEKELHFAKKNLKVHEWALKKLQEIEK